VGYVDIEPTEAGRAWFKAPMKVYQWHREGMTIPTAASCWPPTTPIRCRASAAANAFGFQFHPEVTLEMKQIWTLSAASAADAGRQQRGVHLACTALRSAARSLDRRLPRSLAGDGQRSSPNVALPTPRLSRR
jgi:GMP synthase (glutamine-hydrolysing)